MNRRDFLKFLGAGAIVAVSPKLLANQPDKLVHKLGGFSEQYIKPAMTKLAEDIHIEASQMLEGDVFTIEGTPGTFIVTEANARGNKIAPLTV